MKEFFMRFCVLLFSIRRVPNFNNLIKCTLNWIIVLDFSFLLEVRPKNYLIRFLVLEIFKDIKVMSSNDNKISIVSDIFFHKNIWNIQINGNVIISSKKLNAQAFNFFFLIKYFESNQIGDVIIHPKTNDNKKIKINVPFDNSKPGTELNLVMNINP